MAVGMITEAEQAEAIVAEGKADLVAMARGLLNDPYWAWHAADRLGGHVHVTPQYLRGRVRGVDTPREVVLKAARCRHDRLAARRLAPYQLKRPPDEPAKIGRASCRERVCQDV